MYLSQFDYTIKHRKGKLHSNADYLSRPVMLVSVSQNETILSYKTDPWEDGFLMYYLEKGRFRKGASRKKINRVIRLVQNFRLEKSVLYTLKDNNWLIVQYNRYGAFSIGSLWPGIYG